MVRSEQGIIIMIDYFKLSDAFNFIINNIDEKGYPTSIAKDKFNLNDKEWDKLNDMVERYDMILRKAYQSV